jgi:methylmalonyl-CoA mutase cobalamin-binding subunit
MLAQLLEAAGMNAIAISVRRVDEIIANVSAEKPDIVFLSGMPPFAVSRAHRLYRSLRAREPQLRLMIGIWNYSDDLDTISQKISRVEAVHISTTLADAVAQVRSVAGTSEAPFAMAAESSTAA